MASATLTIHLTSEAQTKLSNQAARVGRPIEEYVSEILEHAAAAPGIDAILAPLRKEFAESAVSDEELVEQINEARRQRRAESGA